jgi:hypothetical protein
LKVLPNGNTTLELFFTHLYHHYLSSSFSFPSVITNSISWLPNFFCSPAPTIKFHLYASYASKPLKPSIPTIFNLININHHPVGTPWTISSLHAVVRPQSSTTILQEPPLYPLPLLDPYIALCILCTCHSA